MKKLQWRYVNCDIQIIRPLGGLLACLAEDPHAEVMHKTTFFRKGNKFAWRNVSMVRVRPTNESLESASRERVGIHDWLEVKLKLPGANCFDETPGKGA